MGTFVCKVVSDKGEYYSLINDTIDQFVLPAFLSIENFARFVKKYYIRYYSESYDEAEILKWCASPYKTFNLTKWKIHNAVVLLAKMKRGKSLNVEESCELYEFWSFLKYTVADHQYDYPEIEKKAMDIMIDDLKIREDFYNKSAMEDIIDSIKNEVLNLSYLMQISESIITKVNSGGDLSIDEENQLKELLSLSDLSQYPVANEWDWEDILDHAKYSTFQKAYFDTVDSMLYEMELRSSPEKLNKLTGRYISRLAIIAKIAGTNKRSPEEIIKYFRVSRETPKNIEAERKLRKKKRVDRPYFLLGIYKQLVVSNKGRKSKGEFRRYFKNHPGDAIELIMWVNDKLSELGYHNHVRRLQKQYL